MGELSRSCCPEIVQEFYASYTTSVDLITLTEGRSQYQPPLTHTLVIGVRDNLFKKTIRQFLFGPELVPSTTRELDYRLRIMRSRHTMRDANLWE